MIRAIIGRARSLASRFLADSDARVARQTFWTGSLSVVYILGAIAQIAISARVLGPELYGVLAVIIASSSLVFGLVGIPGGNTVVTFATRSLAESRPVEAARVVRFALATSLTLSLMGYGVIALVAFAASDLVGIGRANTSALLLYGVAGVCLSIQSEALAVLRLSDQLSRALLVVLAGTMTRIGFLGAAWVGDGGLFDVVLAYVAGAMVQGAAMLMVATVSAPQAGLTGLLASWSIKVPPDLLRFHAGMFGSSTLGSLNRHLDALLVAQFTGVSDVGVYRAARQVADASRQPFGALASSVQPDLSKRWYTHDGTGLRRTSFRYALVSLSLAVVIFVPIVLFRERIVRFVLGDDFAGVAPLLLILSIGSVLGAASAPLGALPVATGRAWGTLAPMIAGLLISTVAFVLLVPSYGAEGAAWSRTIHYLVAVPVSLLYVASIFRQSRRI